MAVSRYSCVSVSPYKDITHTYWIGAHPNDLVLTALRLKSPYLQIRAYFTGTKNEDFNISFVGYNSTHKNGLLPGMLFLQMSALLTLSLPSDLDSMSLSP